MTQRTISRERSSFLSGFRCDFAAGVLIFGIPYGLAVFAQDVAGPAVRTGNSWPAIAAALGVAMAIAGGAVALRRRISLQDSARSPDIQDLAEGMCVDRSSRQGELSDVARRRVAVTRNRPDDLAARAQRVDAARRSDARRRSRTVMRTRVHSTRLRAVPARATHVRPCPPRIVDLREERHDPTRRRVVGT